MILKKLIIILIFTTFFLSCNKQTSKVDNAIIDSNTQSKKIDNSKYYTQKDTVLITTEIGDTLKIEKTEFNTIIDKHPEFFEKFPNNPDQSYFNNNDKEEFGSELGQDKYYVLYAYFLKKRNGEKEFEQHRKTLIDIFLNINLLFQNFEYGGTYFGHQHHRILGYAEYSIYLMPKTKDDVSKTYDISKQKDLYIKSLRQLIDDESKIDFNVYGKEKIEHIKKLNEIVDKLDRLITENFYMRRAQEFQYSYYEYY